MNIILADTISTPRSSGSDSPGAAIAFGQAQQARRAVVDVNAQLRNKSLTDVSWSPTSLNLVFATHVLSIGLTGFRLSYNVSCAGNSNRDEGARDAMPDDDILLRFVSQPDFLWKRHSVFARRIGTAFRMVTVMPHHITLHMKQHWNVVIAALIDRSKRTPFLFWHEDVELRSDENCAR